MSKPDDKICVHAWTGLFVTALGEAGMCCIQHPLPSKITPLTDVKNVRREKQWNKIRQSMLRGEEHPSCKQCWDIERENILPSYRQGSNRRFSKEYEAIKQAQAKKLTNDKLLSIDIRQTNTCNMKCLSCGPVYSSLWAAELAAESKSLHFSDGKNYNNSINKNGVLRVENQGLEDYVLSNLDQVESVYFAGGEPLVNPLHWSILEKLDQLGRYDISIYYNTNMLKLDYRGTHVFDYWDKFTKWAVGASIDAVGDRAEYVRAGTVWNTVDSHIKQVKQRYPNRLSITSTVSALSVAGLKEMIVYCRDLGIKHQWSNTLINPSFLHFNILPRDYRQHVFDEIEQTVNEMILHHDSKTMVSVDQLTNS